MIKVITKGDRKPHILDGNAYVAIEADDVAELYSLDAKKLAYDTRFTLGMSNAGIEAWSSPSVLEGTSKKVQKFFRVFRITPGL